MPNEDRPPLMTALEVLVAQRDATVAWIPGSDRQAGEFHQNPTHPVDEEPENHRIDAAAIQVPRRQLSRAISYAVEQIRTELNCPPKIICIVVNHDRSESGFRKMARRTFLSFPSIDSIDGALTRTNYSGIATFFSARRADRATAFYATDSGLHTPPHFAHPFVHFANALGSNRLSRSSTVILASREERAEIPVLAVLSDWLPDDFVPSSGSESRLLGFSLRDRGTLVLFVETGITSERFVAKFSLRSEADEPLRNSYRLQKWLKQELVGSNQASQSAIPEPLSLVDEDGGFGRSVYLETFESGVLAWKVNTGSRGSRIENDALTFLTQLQGRTRKVKLCDSDLLNRLLHPAIERAESAGPRATLLTRALRRLQACIRDFHVGKEVGFVASHGDFGVGNLLVEQSTGALRTVFDWADGRRTELPSVDPFNWLIQQRRDRQGLSFVEAVKALRTEISEGSLRIEPSFLVEGKSHRQRSVAALHTAVFRYLERSLRYPWSFRADCGSPDEVVKLVDRLVGDWQTSK